MLERKQCVKLMAGRARNRGHGAERAAQQIPRQNADTMISADSHGRNAHLVVLGKAGNLLTADGAPAAATPSRTAAWGEQGGDFINRGAQAALGYGRTVDDYQQRALDDQMQRFSYICSEPWQRMGQGGKAPARWTPVALPSAWGLAWVGAVLIGEPVLVVESELDWIKIILLSAVGVAVAAGLRGSAPVLATLAVAVGIVCGLGGGLAAADAGDPATAFAGLAVTVMILALLVSALAVSLQRPWTRIALRVAGSWMAAIGLLTAGWLLQGVG